MFGSIPVCAGHGAAMPFSAATTSVQFLASGPFTVHLPPPIAAIVPTLYVPTSLRLSPKETIELNTGPESPPPQDARTTATPNAASLNLIDVMGSSRNDEGAADQATSLKIGRLTCTAMMLVKPGDAR